MSRKSSEKMKKKDSGDRKRRHASRGDTARQQPRGIKQWWTIAIFALCAFLVIGVITYSLIKHQSNISNVPTDNSDVQPIDSSSIQQIISNADGNITSSTGGGQQLSILGVRAIRSNTGSSALLEMGVGDLSWVKEVISIFANNDFVFVILQENDSKSINTLANRIADATAQIEARGARVGTLTLSDSNPELSTTMHRLTIGQLPAVLMISNTGGAAIISDNITEETLLQTYLVISQPAGAPGSSPSCCGGK